MASSDGAPHFAIPSAPSPAPTSENFRSKSIATRLTEAEFSEVEAAANSTGKKVAEWLREAALTQARTGKMRRLAPYFWPKFWPCATWF